MFHMILLVACRNIAASESKPTFGAYEIQATEVIPFTEGMLFAIRPINGKELRRNDIAAVQAFKAVQVVYGA